MRQETFTSEATTRGVRVHVESWFDPSRSDEQESRWFFLYRVTLSNQGMETVQLLNRHWIITSGEGRVEEVHGPGVVGEQPVLKPGEEFNYTSGCPLGTEVGTMEGSYEMATSQGELFSVAIGRFTLSRPYTVH